MQSYGNVVLVVKLDVPFLFWYRPAMSKLVITRDELLVLLEEALCDPLLHLASLPTARFQDSRDLHGQFDRRAALRLTVLLREAHFAWARVPTEGDGLNKLLVHAMDSLTVTDRRALQSADAELAARVRERLANAILERWRKTNTVVVRRAAPKTDLARRLESD